MVHLPSPYPQVSVARCGEDQPSSRRQSRSHGGMDTSGPVRRADRGNSVGGDGDPGGDTRGLSAGEESILHSGRKAVCVIQVSATRVGESRLMHIEASGEVGREYFIFIWLV